MAQRTPPRSSSGGSRSEPGRSSSGRPAGGRGGSRRAAPIKKPFPVGFAVGCTVLAVALIGIIVFAVQNQGSGAKGTLKAADQIDGVKVTSGLAQKHVTGRVTYPDAATLPPDGGPHNAVPQTCQVYTAAIPSEHAVHSLEHGGVWVTYDPAKLSKGDVATLAKKVSGNPYRMLSPYPGLAKPVSLQAWGRRLLLDKVSDKRLDTFLDNYTSGPQAPERGAACSGSTATGTLPVPAASAPAK